jgi:hypothetical protein
MFSFISKNWKGEPVTGLKVVVNLIAQTTAAKKGLKVHAESDSDVDSAGVRVPDSERADIRLPRHALHDEWNYEVLPEKVY